jgi:hypothetical protein
MVRQAHHERDEEAHHERRQQSRLGLGGADFRVADLKLSARIEPFPFMVRQAHHERDEEAHHKRDEEAHHERNLETVCAAFAGTTATKPRWLGGSDFRVAHLKPAATIMPFPFVVSSSNHERALPGQLGLSAPGRSLNHSKSSATIKPFPFVVSSSNHERKLLD